MGVKARETNLFDLKEDHPLSLRQLPFRDRDRLIRDRDRRFEVLTLRLRDEFRSCPVSYRLAGHGSLRSMTIGP